MPGRTRQRQPSVIADVASSIPRIFEQAQVSCANHQKNFVALYKLHTEAAQHTEPVNNGRGVKFIGERRFEEILTLMLMRIFPLKKGVGPADRIVKFVGGYVKFMNEKAAEEKSAVCNPDDDEDEDTTASRFTARLLKFLLKGFLAKEKIVRYRVLCMVAEMVSHLGAIDEEIYTSLRAALLDRISDREPAVRVQVVISLSKLVGSEDPSEVVEGEATVLDILLDMLAHDPSPEVRRAVLLNIPLNPVTLPHVLARTRDTDLTMRKLVYSAILEHNATLDEDDHKDAQKFRTKEENELAAAGHDEDTKPEVSILDEVGETAKAGARKRSTQAKTKYIGPTHPRALTIEQRELIVRNGLGDRESNVRAAAEALLGTWVDVVNVGFKNEEEVIAVKEESDQDIQIQSQLVKNAPNAVEEKAIAFLKLFYLENEVASDALLSAFASRPEIYDGLEFSDPYWTLLTPERAFLARVFVDHCCATKNSARLEATLPVVTALAFRIQEAYNNLVDRVRTLEEERLLRPPEDLAKEEDERADREFVIGEMLKLAVNLDYSDEIGRRKMFQLMRDMLSQEALPERLVTKCLDVLRELSASERDLIRVVVEIIQDLRDPGDDDEEGNVTKDLETETNYGETPATAKLNRAPIFNKNKKPEDLTPEERAHADEIDLRCLSICIGMLERVNGRLEDNSTLNGVLMDLIIPSVQRKEAVFKEKGLVSLGLCCLIARELALKSFSFFFNQAVASLPEELKINVLEVVFDMLMVHEHDFLQGQGETPQMITDKLIARLNDETSDKVKALLAIGISKLVLCGMITDIKAIKKLIVTYLSPETASNQELRQCLTFFFPVYCYSSTENQRRIREISLDTFVELNNVRRELGEVEEMVSPTQVATMFVDWTDPLKLSEAINARGKGKAPAVDDSIQLDLANDILKALLEKNNFEKEDKRVLMQMLSKLYIPDTIDDDKIRTLKLLIHCVQTRRPLRDATSNNALRKFDAAISKKFEKQLESFSEEEYRKLTELDDLFKFLDEIIPEDDTELEIDVPKRKGRKRRSESVITTSTESGEADSIISFDRDGKSQAKRRRVSSPTNDSDESGEETECGMPPPEKPTRTLPKRNAAIKKTVQVVLLSDDSDEATSSRKRPPRSRDRHRKKAADEDADERHLDEDIDRLLDGEQLSSIVSVTPLVTMHNSIMDDSDEEDEVNESLLVEDY
ncbi:hypothetical protein AX17_003189 [Amanita inopinata Kibby_2008]|nr:hypothetical protein AX17_003189 [Amanita inopinata Kibby_2008]